MGIEVKHLIIEHSTILNMKMKNLKCQMIKNISIGKLEERGSAVRESDLIIL